MLCACLKFLPPWNVCPCKAALSLEIALCQPSVFWRWWMTDLGNGREVSTWDLSQGLSEFVQGLFQYLSMTETYSTVLRCIYPLICWWFLTAITANLWSQALMEDFRWGICEGTEPCQLSPHEWIFHQLTKRLINELLKGWLSNKNVVSLASFLVTGQHPMHVLIQ